MVNWGCLPKHKSQATGKEGTEEWEWLPWSLYKTKSDIADLGLNHPYNLWTDPLVVQDTRATQVLIGYAKPYTTILTMLTTVGWNMRFAN